MSHPLFTYPSSYLSCHLAYSLVALLILVSYLYLVVPLSFGPVLLVFSLRGTNVVYSRVTHNITNSLFIPFNPFLLLTLTLPCACAATATDPVVSSLEEPDISLRSGQ